MTKSTDVRLAEMVALYREGQSLEDVGRHFGVSRQRIYQIFQAASVIVRTKSIANDYAIQKKHGIGGAVEREDKSVIGGRAPSQRDLNWRGAGSQGRPGQLSRAGRGKSW